MNIVNPVCTPIGRSATLIQNSDERTGEENLSEYFPASLRYWETRTIYWRDFSDGHSTHLSGICELWIHRHAAVYE